MDVSLMPSISNCTHPRLLSIHLVHIFPSLVCQLERYGTDNPQFCESIRKLIRTCLIKLTIISIPAAIIFRLCFSARQSCVEKASIFSRCVQQAENKARGAIIALLLAKRFADPFASRGRWKPRPAITACFSPAHSLCLLELERELECFQFNDIWREKEER